MTVGFDWVRFYEEMTPKLLAYRNRQVELVSMLEKAGVNGLVDQNPRAKSIPLVEMDPFTFLSLINKQSHVQRQAILAVLKSELGIQADVPKHFSGIPKADPRQAWLFPYRYERNTGDVDKLWALYESVLSGKSLSNEVFAQAQSVKFAGRAKLTQAIFRAAPSRFFPVDGQTTSYLARLRLSGNYTNAVEYQAICAQVRKLLGKELYEQSHEAWAANQKTPGIEASYQQAALRKASAAKRGSLLKEPPGGVKLPRLRKSDIPTAGGFQRNIAVAAAALVNANFQCEIHPGHITFVSRAKGKPYVEAHHLVPLSHQAKYEYSLDVTANVVALCPNCHRRMHHGTDRDKKADLAMLLRRRKSLLAEKEIKLSERELLQCYQGDIVDDDV